MDARIGSQAELKVLSPEQIQTLLEPGELGAMLDWEVKDLRTGLVMPDPRTGLPNKGTKKSESFVQQFLQLLYTQMAGVPLANALTVKDTGGSNRTLFLVLGGNSYLFDVCDVAADANYGIVVGTGNTAPTISDYQLGTLIANGVGAGAMQYGTVSFGAPGAGATTSQLTITRNFTSNTGGITVNELGLYCRGFDGGAVRYFMIIRDVIAGGITVPAGQTLTINYRLQAVI